MSADDTLKSFGASQWGLGAPSVTITENDQRYVSRHSVHTVLFVVFAKTQESMPNGDTPLADTRLI